MQPELETAVPPAFPGKTEILPSAVLHQQQGNLAQVRFYGKAGLASDQAPGRGSQVPIA